jgi:hypothetical protein
VKGVDVLRVRFKAKALELLWQGEPAAQVFPRS